MFFIGGPVPIPAAASGKTFTMSQSEITPDEMIEQYELWEVEGSPGSYTTVGSIIDTAVPPGDRVLTLASPTPGSLYSVRIKNNATWELDGITYTSDEAYSAFGAAWTAP